jgi:Cys-tRNA(Pro) deacylase
VAAYLRQAGAEARVEEFAQETASAAEAAAAIGCALPQIVKTLVFDCDGRSVLVLVPGDRRADRTKVALAAKATRAQIVRSADVERLTGFAPGAVAPFPAAPLVTVLLDQGLLVHDLVWVGAGSTRHLAGLPPAELLRLTRARPADLVDAAVARAEGSDSPSGG